MKETVILIRGTDKPSSKQIFQGSPQELARALSSDKSIIGVIFCERMEEDGPPPAPRDKGGD